MQYRILGRTGVKVWPLCLGTMNFGGRTNPAQSKQILDQYLELGGNFIDTANVYNDGRSEQVIGQWLKDSGMRDRIVLSTKVHGRRSPHVNDAGNHRWHIVREVEQSLRRLNTERIDVYHIHRPDPDTPIEEVMRAFDDLVRQGKVLYIGVSDAPAWWIAQANTMAELRGWTPFIGLQIEYSLVERTVERELIPMAKAFDLGLVAWSPLAGGLLSGKYQAGQAKDARLSTESGSTFKRTGEQVDRIVRAVKEVSGQVGRPAAQVALAWLQHRDIPVIPIIGARRMEQLQDNLASLELQLTPEQVAALDKASAIEMGFPHDFYAIEMVKAFRYGGLRDKILAA